MPTTTHLDQSLGARLKWMRRSQGLTLEDIAIRAKLTRGFLSKIENGKSSPPIATLMRLATALGVDPTTFFEPHGRTSEFSAGLMVRAGDGTRMDNRGGGPGYTYDALAARRALKLMEPFLITVRPEDVDYARTFRHPGEEFIFVIEGAMDYRVGDELFAMRTGDSLYFDASKPHAPLPKDGTVRFIAIFCAPPRPATTPRRQAKARKRNPVQRP